MIGQSFAPLGGDPMMRPGGQGGQGSGAQQAIQVLNYRMPRVAGAGAPAPQALLEGAGSAGLPQQNAMNPTIAAILQAVLGHMQPQQQQAPSAPGGQAPPPAQMPNPRINFQPLPGGTAGPNPQQPPQRPGPPVQRPGFGGRPY